MKGIVLAGGSGTRLHPLTKSVSKQLLPIYDKPMVYYPISVLISSGIKDILIISTPDDLSLFIKLLGDGSQFGVNFSYLEQQKPEGIAQAFIIGKNFIADDPVCLVLGDNLFYGKNFKNLLLRAKKNALENKSTIFGFKVNDPERFGIVEFNSKNEVLSVEEKPKKPKSNYAIVGLYFYPNSVVSVSQNITPSDRGELEITSVNNEYLKKGDLKIEIMSDNFRWLDSGTFKSLLKANNFVKDYQEKYNIKIGCLKDISKKEGFI